MVLDEPRSKLASSKQNLMGKRKEVAFNVLGRTLNEVRQTFKRVFDKPLDNLK